LSSQKSLRYTQFEFKGPVVKGYDAFNRISTMGLDVQWRKKTARLVSRFLDGRTQPRVMDLACGTGDMAIAVRQAVKHADITVVGVEPAEEMLTSALPKIQNNEFFPVQAVGNLPFADESFDAITIAFGVRNFVNIQQDMHECYRLLKPGGQLFVLEFFQPESALVAKFLSIYQRIFFPLFGFMLTGHISQYRYLYKSIIRFMKRKEFITVLQKCGFRSSKSHAFFGGMVHTITVLK